MPDPHANGAPRGAGSATDGRERPLRIAMLAPPWIPVPPSGYGGIESVVAMLSGALEAVGRLGEIDRQRCREDTIGRYDIDHVAAAYEHAYERVVAAARGG